MIRDLMYIELKTGYFDDGPAWLAYVKYQKQRISFTLTLMLFKNIMAVIQII